MAITGAPELLIVMGASATQDQVDEVVARLEEAGCSAFVTPGREATVIGAIGDREMLATLPLEGFAGVEQVLPILKPYKLVSRELSPDPTVIEVRGRRIGDGYFGFIAGPCTVESREQTLESARVVAREGVTMLRGGAFKPRTSPYTFQGLGEVALEILVEAREETGLPLVTELMDPRHVEEVVETADVIQIGARNMSNFSLLAEVGRATKPILLKRGLSATVEDLLMAAEYIVKEGNSEVILCERGIKTFETATRFTLDIGAIPVLKQETHLPVIVDPSHPAGRRDLVLPLARAAVAAGAHRVIGATQPRPEEALCDGPQLIPTADDRELVVHGADLRDAEIDCGNAGTLMRLIAGLLAGRGTYVLTGDESLSARPMERIAEPLRRMGAAVETTDGHAPIRIAPAALRGIDYELPVASAQVKSAVLLAGLAA